MSDSQFLTDLERECLERQKKDNVKLGWKDPECPKCGQKISNKMMFCCHHSYCPAGLN